MRNLAQYPVTVGEIVDVLESIPQVNPPGTPPSQLRIGGINDLIRRGIIEHFKDGENMASLLLSFRRCDGGR